MAKDEVIRSRSNSLVRRLRSLKRQASDELALLEGDKLLEEALAARVEILEIAATPRFRDDDRGGRLLGAAADRRVPVRLVDEGVLASLSELEMSQGVLALARRPVFSEQPFFRNVPLIVVAVGIQDPGNLGGILRTAEAAGASGAYLTEGAADPLSWKALRGSMGSAFRLPHVRGLPAREVFGRLEARRVSTVAAIPRGARPYSEADFRRPVAFVFGSEGAGLPEDLARAVDSAVSIPMHGPVESLNVGIAAGILLFEAARQRRGG